jgi:hypothetical protein
MKSFGGEEKLRRGVDFILETGENETNDEK